MTLTIAGAPGRSVPVLTRRGGPSGRHERGTTERTATLVLAAAIIFQPILHPTGPGNS